MSKVVNSTAALIACFWAPAALAAPNAASEGKLGGSAAVHLPPRAAVHEARMLEYAAHGGELESVLLRQDDAANGQRLTGMTRLGDGTRLWEEARFDHAGKLVRAETMCSCPSGASETTVLDAQTGVVEVRNATGAHRWSVPTDYPWIWVPGGCSSGARTASVTTPVSAVVAARAAEGGGVRRLVDPRRLVSHTITSDQVMVEEDAGASWVVLGDDAVLVRDGVPQRWRANALGVDVEQR